MIAVFFFFHNRIRVCVCGQSVQCVVGSFLLLVLSSHMKIPSSCCLLWEQVLLPSTHLFLSLDIYPKFSQVTSASRKRSLPFFPHVSYAATDGVLLFYPGSEMNFGHFRIYQGSETYIYSLRPAPRNDKEGKRNFIPRIVFQWGTERLSLQYMPSWVDLFVPRNIVESNNIP